ncbi:RNA polymerase II holoenzyme cyclin-like subunit [Corynascus novoguineensis]|uniref:RNA polymerase II holoenzyme cyclin-like subunit n=1 Tax=Corynascus novoguineensis TaxID=1126955 RepID=A0AAN7HIR2_9PEZI|nr:RNA polymerase II holoenzyme cyclin-like subunit [Corynascus novoguineensis]
MAANYWESTQRKHWQFTKDELAAIRQRLDDEDPGLVQMFPLPPLRHLNIYFNQQINRLGKRLGVRQQAMATTQVYLKRFYTRTAIRQTNPYLVITTALYLACKMEECPQHIRLLTQEARSLWPSDLHGHDAGRVGECEFSLISEMRSQLIVHQPYRSLLALQDEFGLAQDETSLAWTVINDHYMTDLPLLHPPHVIALTAVLLALVLRPSSNSAGGSGSSGNSNANAGAAAAAAAAGAGGVAMAASALAQAQAQAQAQAHAKAAAMVAAGGGGGSQGSSQQQQASFFQGGSQGEGTAATEPKKATDPRLAKVQRFAAWLADSNIDIEAMVDCTQELISFYECHEQYNDKHTREQISRFIKARNLDK